MQGKGHVCREEHRHKGARMHLPRGALLPGAQPSYSSVYRAISGGHGDVQV